VSASNKDSYFSGQFHGTSSLLVVWPSDNITPIFLPSRAPELNPVEKVWQYLRQKSFIETLNPIAALTPEG
jgi:hypothetical protein